MANFVELWVYLASAPLFGLTATLAVYVLAQALSVRSGHAPWANPVMVSVAILASVMLATGTAYPTYFAGAQFIHFLLGPAVVALGWPLWQRRAALRSRWGRLVLASLAVVVLAQLLFTYAPFMHALFDSRALDVGTLLAVVAVGVAVLVILELEKAVLRHGAKGRAAA